MKYHVLFLLLTLTTTQITSIDHHQNSDLHLPANHVSDVQQAMTLQYCLIDDHAIMRVDTGQQLDIVYTTKSLLVVTSKDSHTSMVISKNEPERFCHTNNIDDDFYIQFKEVSTLIISTVVSFCIVVIHVIFKEPQSTFGKMMMLYNIGLAFQCANLVAISIKNFYVEVHSVIPCYLFFFLFVQLEIMAEGCATCMLAYLTYIMHQNCKSMKLTKEFNKKLYKYFIRYIFGLLLLCDIFIVGTDAYKLIISQNGDCYFVDQSEYGTVGIAFGYNAIIQVLLLAVYLVSYFELNKMAKMAHSLAKNGDQKQNQLFITISTTLGSGIAISKLIYVFSQFVIPFRTIALVGTMYCIMQQGVIMILHTCTKCTPQLYKRRSPDTESDTETS